MKRMIGTLILVALTLLQVGASAQEKPPDSAEKPQPVVLPPVLTKFVDAVYPEAELKSKTQGSVHLLVVIDEKGAVAKVDIAVSAGPNFDKAALAAVAQFLFSPATVNGKAVPVRVRYVYHFKLEEKEVKAEPGQVVEGTIKEKGVGLPVVGAELAIPGARTKGTTNKRGRFKFKNIEPGEYKLFVVHPEYKKLETVLKVEPDKTLQVKLLVEPLLVNPYETVVVGKKEKSVVTKYVLEQKTLETVPGTFGDPVRVIETLPGVARAPFGAGVLVIRGSVPNQSRVYVFGVEVPLLYHFLGGPSILNPNFIDQIAYYPGNFPVRYGGAISGVVDITPKTSKVEKWAGEADLNLINAAAYLEGQIGDDLSIRMGARRSYVDLVIKAAVEAAGGSSTIIAPIFWDWQTDIAWEPNSKNRLGLFWLGSHDSFELVTTDEDEDLDIDLAAKTNFQRLVGSWRYARKGLSVDVRPYFGFDSFTFETVGIGLDAKIYTVASRQELRWEPAKWLDVLFGVEGGVAMTDFDGDLPRPPSYYMPGAALIGYPEGLAETVMPWKLSDTYGAWAGYTELAFKPTEKWRLAPGFRFSQFFHPDGFVSMWDPRFVARYQVMEDLALKGGVGKFSQPPEPQYTDKEFGNPDVTEQWAMHYSGGVEWRITDLIELEVVGFFVTWHDLITQSSEFTVADDGSLVPQRAGNDGWGRSYGMELLLRHKANKRFFGWISYTLSRSELAGFDQIRGDATDATKGDELVLSPFDQTHILSAVASVKMGRGWETGARVRLVSGNPSTPIERGVFVSDSNTYQPVQGPVRSERLAPFFQIDFRVEKTWTFEKWLLSAYLDVQNLTNHSNTEFTIWDYRFGKKWNVPGIPVFPSFGVSGRF